MPASSALPLSHGTSGSLAAVSWWRAWYCGQLVPCYLGYLARVQFFKLGLQLSQAFCTVQVPAGDLTVDQLRFLGDCIKPLEGGCGDITTRANIQLRGVTLKEVLPSSWPDLPASAKRAQGAGQSETPTVSWRSCPPEACTAWTAQPLVQASAAMQPLRCLWMVEEHVLVPVAGQHTSNACCGAG